MFLLSPVSSAGTRVGCGSVPTDSKMSGLPSSVHCTLSTTTTKVWAFLTHIFLSVFQCLAALLGLIFYEVCYTLIMKTHRHVGLYFHLGSGQIFLFLWSAIYSIIMLWSHEHMHGLWPDLWFYLFTITFYYLNFSYKKLLHLFFFNLKRRKKKDWFM